jgi:hypothetical protein
MLYFEKSQPAPECLAIEKEKKNGSYRCGCVVDRLNQDFKGKCYICGNGSLYSINVEHFVPHKGVDKELEFSWGNLFLCCSHCNNIKGAHAKYDDILNCTDPLHDVEGSIACYIDPFPGEKVNVVALKSDARVERTAELIRDVFNGSTPLKKLESANMRDSLLAEMLDFNVTLHRYFDEKNDEDDKSEYRRIVKRHLSKASKFSSFKRRVILEKAFLFHEFGCFINP